MNSITVSVTCPNCGSPVVFNLHPTIGGGMAECCYNCSATVSCCVSWNGNTPRIYGVRSSGGAKKR